MSRQSWIFAALLFLIWFAITNCAHAQNGAASFGHDLLSCSPVPCVLPPTQASEGGYPVVDAPIVADPVNPRNLLLGSWDGNCIGGFSMGFYLTTDQGSTWQPTTCMPTIHAEQRVFYPGGDPMVAYGSNGEAYIAGEYGDSMGVGFGLVAAERSSDGVTWSKPNIVFGGVYRLFLYSSMAADVNPQSPYANNLYISTMVIGEPLQASNQVFVSHSSDGGKTWKAAPVDPQQHSPNRDFFTNLAVGRDGSVYVTWMRCEGSNGGYSCPHSTAFMLFSKSLDSGNTWTSPQMMATIIGVPTGCMCYPFGPIPNTNVHARNYPVIGVDNSSGPYAGALYATMYSWTGTYMQVQVVHSTDGGTTWSNPVPVAPPTDTHDQFFPWLSVSSTGLVGVTWLDRRNDPNNINYQAFAAISRDGGLTFQPNVPLTSKFSNPNIGNENYMGDYIGSTWVGPTFVSAWMDSSNGINMQDVVGGVKLK